MEEQVNIDIPQDENTINRILMQRASSACCVGVTIFVAFIIILPFLLARLLSYIIAAPIGIFCYYYRTKKYTQWLNEWQATLSVEQIELITTYINGTISLSTFDAILTKIKPHIYIGISQATPNYEQERMRYNYVPKYLLQSRFWPCNTMVNKPDFIEGLTFMLNILIKKNGNNDTIAVSKRFLIGLIIDIQPQCCICMQDYITAESEELYITNCTHLYHKSCIDTWKLQNPICPICRADIA